MCGIAGFTRFSQPFGDEKLLSQMGEAIRHRGPDSDGSFLDEGVGLHHRRLAIIDLSEAGHQPMHSTCSRYAIVFNGEIYNFESLREELLNDGYEFSSKTDTEVILALYDRDGSECVNALNGMFAFAIWDRETQSLFFARDRLGKKPLYYSFIDNDIVFASELKSLLATNLIKREIRIDAVYDFFAYQYVPDPKTIFESVFKLEPGHWMKVDSAGYRKQQYWDPFTDGESDNAESAITALRDQIHIATKRRMIADVPLGAFLSGGIDSSGVVATMAEYSDEPVTTCAIGFDAESFNETDFARVVAEQYKTIHHELTVSGNVTDEVRKITAFFDEPFADPSLVPTYFVSKLARQKVTVALSGDGGDEVFAGYEKYSVDALENRWRSRIPTFLRKSVFPKLASSLRDSQFEPLRRAASLLTALSNEPAMAFYQSNAQVTDAQWQELATPKTHSQLGSYHPSTLTTENYERCRERKRDHLACILYTDIKTFLPGGILVKVDRMSMAHSLEVRAPLLDYELVEFANRLSSKLKMRAGIKKYVLKMAFGQDLPSSILKRKKMGFTPPVADWLRKDLKLEAESALLDSADGLTRYLDRNTISKLWSEHQNLKRDHSSLLWSLFVFQLWWDEYML